MIVTQTVAMLIDGNNIERAINFEFGENYRMSFDVIVPKILKERGLNRLVYLREGKHISGKLAERLKTKFFGTVQPCHKSADIYIAIHAVKLAEKVDTIILFSGDGDFLPLVEYLKSVGVRVEVVCMQDSASRFLIESADDYYFIQKDDVFC